MIKFKILALDLEGTLIDNALDNVPRSGLYNFLEFCKSKFERIVIMTAIDIKTFINTKNILIENNFVPDWFANIEYINYHDLPESNFGEFKDLRCISMDNPGVALIIDDMESNIRENQKQNWIFIRTFYGSSSDNELIKLKKYLNWLLKDYDDLYHG